MVGYRSASVFPPDMPGVPEVDDGEGKSDGLVSGKRFVMDVWEE